MELWVDLRHEVASLNLYSDDEVVRTAQTVRVEHRIGDQAGELVLKFDDQGHLSTVLFMHASRQLRPSQIAQARRYEDSD